MHEKLDKILKFIEKLEMNDANANANSNANANANLKFDINMYIKCLIHELRTPITTISLGLNVIERKVLSYQSGEKKVTPECSQDSLGIVRDLHNTVQFIENTLTKFCVIQDGDMVLNPFTPFSIHSLINDVEKILQYNIKEKNILFECNIDSTIHEWIYGDKYNIKHCIMNLIKNAIKYCNQTNIHNKIIIHVKLLEDHLIEDDEQSMLISIIDNNHPIPKHIKDKLFQPFNSTSGSGLGLYICNKIIELHNGTIQHEYIENYEGNKFDIIFKSKKCINGVLQINDESLEIEKNIIHNTNQDKLHRLMMLKDEQTSVKSISNDQSLKNDSKYNIILVDDSEINLKLMQKIFQNNEQINKIFTAVDGLDAIQQICSYKDEIDIVFIDNLMPKLNGSQTVQLLRGIHFDKLIFGITGSSNNDLSDFNNCGLDFVFTKPLNKDKINILFDFLNKKDINRHKDQKLKIIDFKLEWV